ncbi:MAG: AglZ/HisF2 family acetamidino modification protein [Candidatus Rifleibacteriota bacterium]
MLSNRVIPCLLLRNGGLVKTRKFSNPKYVGDPLNAIKIFNEKEVDELMVLDILASQDKRSPDFELIEKIAGECFMPLCYGGGISCYGDAKKIFSLGVEKICIQSAAIFNPDLIRLITKDFGNQSVVVSVDVKRNWFGTPKLFSSLLRKSLNTPLLNHIQNCIELGAGEILLNSVDKDGMMNGMDNELISEISRKISIPLTAAGGASSLLDLKKAVESGASAVAAGSMFVFHGPHQAVLITYPDYENLESLFEKSYEE